MKKLVIISGIISMIFSTTVSQAEVFKVIKKIQAPNSIRFLRVNPTGQSIGYLLFESSGGRPRPSFWIDGARVSCGRMESGGSNGELFTMSPSGSKLTYFGKCLDENGKKFAWINRNKISPEFVMGGLGTFSPDGSKVAYPATKDGKMWSIWMNDKKVSPEFSAEFVQGTHFLPVVSSDGGHVAYVVFNAGKFSVWIDDRRISPEFDNLFPTINFEGSTCAYVGQIKGKYSVWINDHRVSGEFEGPPKRKIPAPIVATLSYDKTKIAYVGGDYPNGSVMVNGNRVSPPFSCWISSIAFSPDGNGIAYTTCGDRKGCIWINDKKSSPEFDQISFSKEYFAKTGKLIFAGYDNAKGEILLMQGN